VHEADNLTTFVWNVMEIWEPKPPGTLWATPGLLWDSLNYYYYYYYYYYYKLQGYYFI
jgi:hypothetical protein